ncbi:MAG: hypothetical protein PHQ74_14870 [Crocinitomicaceae bacterium]|nr:hypothetical protein [Crocinitomicaceae bacterium]
MFIHVFVTIISNLVSGIIIIFLGLFFYKRTRKNETISEALIQKELKTQYVVNEFRRIRGKYSKALTEDSFSSKLEQELTNLYGYCENIIFLCKEFNLPVDSDLDILMNHIYCEKGVLYFNNPTLINDEKISSFMNLNKMTENGINFDKVSSKKVYYKLYCDIEMKMNNLIESKSFFKKYWQ